MSTTMPTSTDPVSLPAPTRNVFDASAMLRYLIGWFSTRRHEPTTGNDLPNMYQVDDALFYAAQDEQFVERITERGGFRCAFWDLSEKGVQWIRANLLAADEPPAPCESCGDVVTTRIPDVGGKPMRPSCIACEVGRQLSLSVLLAAESHDPDRSPDDGVATQLDLF